MSFPNGYQLVPVGLLSPFTCLERLLQIQSIKGFRSLVIWEAPKRQVSFSESSPGIWPLPGSGIHKCPRKFCVVNRACVCEDRGCELGGGAEPIATTDHAEQLHRQVWLRLPKASSVFLPLVSGCTQEGWWIGTLVSGISSGVESNQQIRLTA